MRAALAARIRTSRTLLLYCLIGGTGATLDLVVFVVLTATGMAPAPATVISVSCGIVNNFVLNVVFNYRVTDRLLLRFASFYAVGLVGIVLSAATLALLTDVLGVPVLLSKLISIPVIVLAQFGLNNFVTFARSNRAVPVPPVAVARAPGARGSISPVSTSPVSISPVSISGVVDA